MTRVSHKRPKCELLVERHSLFYEWADVWGMTVGWRWCGKMSGTITYMRMTREVRSLASQSMQHVASSSVRMSDRLSSMICSVSLRRITT